MSKPKRRRYRPRKPLTPSELEALPAPDSSGRQTVYVAGGEHRGLGLVVSGVSASRTWFCQGIVEGKTIRIPIGPAHLLSFDEAWARAKKPLKQMIDGEDPRPTRQAQMNRGIPIQPGSITLQQALAAYLSSPELAENSKLTYRGACQRYLSDWMPKPLSAITRQMVVERYQAIRDRATGGSNAHRRNGVPSANLTMTTLGSVWNSAVDAGHITGDAPTKALDRRKGRKGGQQRGIIERRNTMFEVNDLPRLFKAIIDLRSDNMVQADYLLTMLFSGVRKTCGYGLTWNDLDRQRRVLCIPASRMKGRKLFELPLPAIVFDRIAARPRLQGNPYIFPGDNGLGHLNSGAAALTKLAARLNITSVERDEDGKEIRRPPCLTDMRRLFATIAHQVTDYYTAEALMAHTVKRNDVGGGYVNPSLDDKRRAMDKIAKRMVELCRAKPTLVGKGKAA